MTYYKMIVIAQGKIIFMVLFALRIILFSLWSVTHHVTHYPSPMSRSVTHLWPPGARRYTSLTDWSIDLRPCLHDNGYMDGRSQIKVHTDERTQVHSAQSSLVVTHPSTNRAGRYLTSVTESPSSTPRTLPFWPSLHPTLCHTPLTPLPLVREVL